MKPLEDKKVTHNHEDQNHNQNCPYYMVFCSPCLDQKIQFILDFINAHPNLNASELRWLSESYSAQVCLSGLSDQEFRDDIRPKLHEKHIDVFMIPAHHRRKKLLIADMDATIVEGETLDDLAHLVGLGEKIASITLQAMRGELDFSEALRQRVKILEGTNTDILSQTYNAMKLSRGARKLVQTMVHFGAQAILVSGGFTFFTEKIAQDCGFSAHHGNQFEIRNGLLTGRLIPPILDKNSKLELLMYYRDRNGLTDSDVIAVGDGANDLPMIKEAAKKSIGVGYYPKPIVANEVSNIVLFSNLDALLYMQGYCESDLQS